LTHAPFLDTQVTREIITVPAPLWRRRGPQCIMHHHIPSSAPANRSTPPSPTTAGGAEACRWPELSTKEASDGAFSSLVPRGRLSPSSYLPVTSCPQPKMLSERQSRQSLSFTENVALLRQLSEAPSTSHANPWPTTLSDQDEERVLSRECEADLTGTLAYLCGISDNPSHVVATCVEELSGGRGLRVVVAVNKESPSSGNDILARIKGGLEKIFSRLASITNGSSQRTKAYSAFCSRTK